MTMLTIRKRADRSVGERVRRSNPDTGEAYLSDPASDNPDEHSPWPLAGVEIADPPQATTISTAKVDEGIGEGWAELIGERVVRRPAGPPTAPWSQRHTFVQADELVFHTMTGDIRYRVVHQPDVHEDQAEPSGRRVDHFYGLERIDG